MEKLNQEQLRRLTTETLYRSISLNREAVNDESRTVEVAFSSEDPYLRWFGYETLGHDSGEVKMGWLASGRAPLLDQHDHSRQIGIIEKAWIDSDRKGRAIVRFGRSAAADEFFQDVKDGIRTNISVGYRVYEMKLTKESDTGDEYRVTSWEPHEVSFVTVPADKTVGVGRSGAPAVTQPIEVRIMAEENTPVNIEEIQKKAASEARESEVNRVRDIIASAERHNMRKQAEEFITNGKSVETFHAFMLEELAKRGMKPVDTDPTIGLSASETRQFSFMRAINALANPTDRKAQDAARFEFEASDAVAAKLHRSASGIMVPFEVMQRDLTVGTTTAGGHLKDTVLMAGSFIDLLRSRMMVRKMGATDLGGLVGDIAIPRQTGGATAYWVAESGAPTESQQAFDQVTLAPKTVGAWTDISRKLLKQSSIDIENFVRGDLAKVLAHAIDSAAITGRGPTTYNEPTGIVNVSGIGAVAGGTNGLAPTWGNIVSLWSAVAQDNADIGTLGYLTSSKVIGKLMQTEKATGTAQFVVKDFPDMDGFTELAGARCGVSNQVPDNLTKGTSVGVCSAILYGNWADLIIGMWGTLDLTVDPYTGGTSGTVRVIALQDVDVAVRHAESFAAMLDALTA
jgi:HK97 family phage major capsid protein/HK97 family phage prohead protease